MVKTKDVVKEHVFQEAIVRIAEGMCGMSKTGRGRRLKNSN